MGKWWCKRSLQQTVFEDGQQEEGDLGVQQQEIPTPLLRTCYLLLLPHAAGVPDATYAIAS